MLTEREFSIKDETQIFPEFFGAKNRATNRRKVKRRGVKGTMQSCEMKDFSF